MPSSAYSSWRSVPHGSSFRTSRAQSGLGGWVAAAIVTSVAVHLALWQIFQVIDLPDYFGDSTAVIEERIPIDLRRAKVDEEAASLPVPPPDTKPIEREKPVVDEPIDITQLAKALPEMELRATPATDVAKNITLSPRPSAGAPNASPASLLATVPSAADTSNLSSQLAKMPGRLFRDPKISAEQVVVPLKDEELPGEDILQDSINAAVKKGNQGIGDADGFASLDDLLSYKGPVTEDKKAMMPTDLLFEYDSAELRDSARLSLMKLGFIIQRNPTAQISIEGHTDLFGGDGYNHGLSQARAEAVRNWLVESLHLDARRLQTRGWGESNPLVPGGSVEQQAKNRRVEIIIRPRR
jgi:outer membrane protein OmpA-like peptidoglycan-associated protein